jgi:hypothetical protein
MANRKGVPGSKRPERGPAEEGFLGMPAKITQLLNSESDRGAILILGAYLDELLGLIVRAACVSDAVADELLEFRRPAGDFDSKILLCTAFGLIHPDEMTALRAIQKIRNRAAHFDKKGGGFDVLFDSPQTADQVANLTRALGLGFKSRERAALRNAFTISARLLATKLYFRLLDTNKARSPLTIKEQANEIRGRMKDTPVGQMISQAEKEAREGNPEKLFQLMASINQAVGAAVKAKKTTDAQESGHASE